MFSGIVDHCGAIQSIEWNDKSATFWISSQFSTFEMGESIAVDGVCLTVVKFRDSQFAVEVSPETLQVTTFEYFKVGQTVNLERALRLQDRLGGHFVTGHVDQMAEVLDVIHHQDFTQIQIDGLSPQYLAYLVAKGSVAVNGVSLTVNSVSGQSLGLMLIPHTLQRTNLSDLEKGAKVNIEYDMMAKLVASQVANYLDRANNINEIAPTVH